MMWRRDVPKIPGWYWFNGLAGAEVVSLQIVELNGTACGSLNTVSMHSCGEECSWPDISLFQGEWWGPVQVPE
jgi:hypothetical protein